jgi:membrane fusion protein (multidrug efflux system)
MPSADKPTDEQAGQQAGEQAGKKKRRFRLLALLLSLVVIAGLGFAAVSASTGSSASDDAADTAGKTDKADKTDTSTAKDSTAKDATDEGTAGEDPDADDEGKTPIPVETVEVATGTVSSYLSATANLVPENEVKVLAEWEGRLADLRVEEGQRVAAGEILAQLADDDAEIALEKARVKESNARMAYERAGRLEDQGLMAREAYDQTTVDHRIAQQELEEAQWKLEKTRIRAPFAGRVTERFVQLGQHLRPGDELFTVADFDPLVARVYFPEKDVLALSEGRPVRITLKADEDVVFNGRIRQISPVVDTATGTVKVTVEAVSPPPEVRPGAFVQVDVVRETREAALVLPKRALIRELQKAYVFVARDGVAEKRALELGIEEGAGVEALAGVEAGEHVIVAGQGGLKNGAPIKEMPTESEELTETQMAAR